MSNYKTIGQITIQKPLAQCGMEELAARQRVIQPRSGVLFARNVDGEEKSAARQLVLDMFHPSVWPGHLHMFTMPGLQWRFERKLLAVREVGWFQATGPRRTYFTSAENDRSIYFAGTGQMPGLHTPNSTLKKIRPFPFAEMGVKTRYASYFFANVDDMLTQDYWDTGWHAAWLDYTGPLTPERLALIRIFYNRYVKHTLVITALKTRYTEATARAIEKAGGHSKWVRHYIDGTVIHDIEYNDTSPMAQIAFRKTQWTSPLV